MKRIYSNVESIHIIGAGLAGCEAAWQIASRGIPVILHEMRPIKMTEAHQTENCAELVCSNSFRSDDSDLNAVGLLHYEMRQLNSIIMKAADAHQVPAGSALAVDREGFSRAVSDIINSHPLITIERGEISDNFEDWDNVIIATGPLTSKSLAENIKQLTGEGELAFFDAMAPIVYKDSINMDIAWFQSRYDKLGPGGTGADYINCPMDREQYEDFVAALIAGDKTQFHEFEKNTPYFDGCLPIEVMAERGIETLRHGPMKPMGLTNSHNPQQKPYAVVQLRQDNKLGTLYNIVGFQTKLKHGAQIEIFKKIPGLENVEFARLGGIHRNTYLNSPRILDHKLRLKSKPNIRFAGQITGCEGYVESASIGLITGLFAAFEMLGRGISVPPPETAMGALVAHITGGHIISESEEVDDYPKASFQPMNVNFGLFPQLEQAPKGEDGKRLRGKEKAAGRKLGFTVRAKEEFAKWVEDGNVNFMNDK